MMKNFYFISFLMSILANLCLCRDVPWECEAANHNIIDDGDLRQLKTYLIDNPAIKYSDETLKSGWYTFISSKGDDKQHRRMMESKDVGEKDILIDTGNVPFSIQPVFDLKLCGSDGDTAIRDVFHGPGHVVGFTWDSVTSLHMLSDAHPLQKDGLVRSFIHSFVLKRSGLTRSIGFDYPLCTSSKTPVHTNQGNFTLGVLQISTCSYRPDYTQSTYQEIFVRNCGQFYVYYLPPTIPAMFKKLDFKPASPLGKSGRYCTSSMSTTTTTPKRSECMTMKVVTINENQAMSSDCSRQDFLLHRWVRFYGTDYRTPYKIVDQCSSVETNSNYPCGGMYHGWFDQPYSVQKEVIFERILCISQPNSCECIATARIQVIDCDGYYVYRKMNEFPLCGVRSCTLKQPIPTVPPTSTPTTTSSTSSTTNAPTTTTTMQNLTTSSATDLTTISTNESRTTTSPTNEVTTSPMTSKETTTPNPTTVSETTTKAMSSLPNLCSSYSTVIGDDRLFDSGSEKKLCDLKFPKPVRFLSSRGEYLSLLENCSTSRNHTPSCNSNGYSWLDGSHPDENTKEPVVRYMCFYNSKNIRVRGKDTCTCGMRQLIWIQRCADFFVYQLQPVTSEKFFCSARYCVEQQPNIISTTKVPETSSSSTTPVITTKQPSQGSYAMSNTLQISNPFVNDIMLRKEDFVDPLSQKYRFLLQAATQLLRQIFNNAGNSVKTIKVEKLRYGSLLVDYEVTSDSLFNQTKLKDDVALELSKTEYQNYNYEEGSFRLLGSVGNTMEDFQDVNECLKGVCDVNADCENLPKIFSYLCSCKQSYQGDGFNCIKVLAQETDNEWSNDAIIAVLIMFCLCFVLIVLLSVCLYIKNTKNKNSYKTSVTASSKSGYDNYYDSTQMNADEKNISLKMYMASSDSPPQQQSRYDKVPAPQNDVNDKDGVVSMNM